MCSKENLHQIKAVHTTSTFQDARSEDDERLKVTAENYPKSNIEAIKLEENM